jgi:hypothetical protein
MAGAAVTSSADVTFVRCTLRGSRGLGGQAGGLGLACTSSSVALFDTSAIGGVGSAQVFGMFGAPGDGVRVDGGSLFTSGGKLEGGRGWDGALLFGCTNAGTGAPGLRLRAGAPQARLRSTALVGGAAGTPAPPCLPGSSGPGQIVESGAVTIDRQAARSLAVDHPLHPGDTLVATLAGAPGDLVRVLVALPAGGSPGPGPAQALLGTAGLPATGLGALFPPAFLDGNGSLELSAAVPASLPLSAGALTVELQALMVTASLPRAFVRSNPELVTFLDPSL